MPSSIKVTTTFTDDTPTHIEYLPPKPIFLWLDHYDGPSLVKATTFEASDEPISDCYTWYEAGEA